MCVFIKRLFAVCILCVNCMYITTVEERASVSFFKSGAATHFHPTSGYHQWQSAPESSWVLTNLCSSIELVFQIFEDDDPLSDSLAPVRMSTSP